VDFAMAASQNSVGITRQSTSVANNNLVSRKIKDTKTKVFDIF
jgi:hypothetical protein